jgi:hypothetical protein
VVYLDFDTLAFAEVRRMMMLKGLVGDQIGDDIAR